MFHGSMSVLLEDVTLFDDDGKLHSNAREAIIEARRIALALLQTARNEAVAGRHSLAEFVQMFLEANGCANPVIEHETGMMNSLYLLGAATEFPLFDDAYVSEYERLAVVLPPDADGFEGTYFEPQELFGPDWQYLPLELVAYRTHTIIE